MLKTTIVDKFLTNEEVLFVLNLVKEAELWEPSSVDFWDKRTIGIRAAYEYFGNELGDFMVDVSRRVQDVIESSYGKKVREDGITICRWYPGMEQPPHADDMTNTEVKGLEHRKFGAIIYLNEDYEGGHTYYPNYDIEVTPESGKLAIHLGDADHLHGVTKIEGNTRYTIASFWAYADGQQ
jgi:hypothetical protein